jgi:hypothetical protein
MIACVIRPLPIYNFQLLTCQILPVDQIDLSVIFKPQVAMVVILTLERDEQFASVIALQTVPSPVPLPNLQLAFLTLNDSTLVEDAFPPSSNRTTLVDADR